MFWGRKEVPMTMKGLCAQARPTAGPFLMAARATDHTTGTGQVAITGRYDSKKEVFGVEAAYAINDNHTVYAIYSVTDEKVSSLGVETGLDIKGRDSTLDLTYVPPDDKLELKLAVKQGKVKVSAHTSFDKVTKDKVKNHAERFEMEAKVSGVENLKMRFDLASKAAKITYLRKLDPKNRAEAEYVYKSADDKHLEMKFEHIYSKMHVFSAHVDYGEKKYSLEWDCKTDNGPWTVSTSFPFNASPHKGDWHIKRRFEF